MAESFDASRMLALFKVLDSLVVTKPTDTVPSWRGMYQLHPVSSTDMGCQIHLSRSSTTIALLTCQSLKPWGILSCRSRCVCSPACPISPACDISEAFVVNPVLQVLFGHDPGAPGGVHQPIEPDGTLRSRLRYPIGRDRPFGMLFVEMDGVSF